MVVLLFLAFPSLYLLYLIEELSTPTVTIKVVAHQWFWEYQYDSSWGGFQFDSYIKLNTQENVNSLFSYYNLDVDNRLILPELRSILFLLTSDDVLHS
jgi:cytochrome c oxidase subunit 2